MGCCQDKDHQTSDEQAREEGNEEGRESRTRLKKGSREWERERESRTKLSGLLALAGNEVDLDNTGRLKQRSNESLLITVLWRRLSMFSRRGSSRSAKRFSEQTQKQDSEIRERKREGSHKEPEKG
ncbi:testis-expressed protein 54 isoform X2 [Peromyscus californicus insignis]|uniref:testis-expressed protein 54 isoform X2 n=1 Tax=Peromyscus californicus insignis TaxID=564181 RepID=UPI0022A71D2D|nr:testis-expressed protein 54 isoform X2 [Peromyscus californicus insignis]